MDLIKVEQSINNIDLTKIAEYTRKLADIGNGFNKIMAPVYIRDFIIAYDVSSVMQAKAVEAEMNAKAAVETAEAIAFLDKAPDYFKARDEKPTVDSKNAYVALDPDVQRAKELHARATALALLLRNKVQEFRFAIESVKKLADDGYMTNYEGMK